MSLPDPYYADGGVTLYHGDADEILPHVSPATVDLVLTDPPYGIDLDTDYAGRKMVSGRTYAKVANDAVPFDPAPLLAYGRAVIWGANNFSASVPPGGWMVWRKTNPHPFSSECELAWTNLTRSVTSYASSIRPDGYSLHPTQKPVGLMRWIIAKWTKPGDLVLDPYMGSGPVAQACHELGRRYVGIELVEDYVRAAVGRLSQGVLFEELGG